MNTSLLKMLIATSSFGALPAALFAAANPSLTYTNSAGTQIYQEDSSNFPAFILEESTSNVIFDSGTRYVFSKDLYLNSGITVTGLTINATGSEDTASCQNAARISGNVLISGKTATFRNNNGGEILSGTTFTLGDGATFDFGNSATHIWNISDLEASSSFALISGTGTVMIRNTTLYDQPYTSFLQLNFESDDILKNTETLTLVDSTNISSTSLGFMGIEITVDGWSTEGYSATLDWDPSSANFGKITITHPIPEPSAFGFVAGTFALALVLPRRRLKVFNG